MLYSKSRCRQQGKQEAISKRFCNHSKEFCLYALQLEGNFSGLGVGRNNTDLGIGEELVNLRDNGWWNYLFLGTPTSHNPHGTFVQIRQKHFLQEEAIHGYIAWGIVCGLDFIPPLGWMRLCSEQPCPNIAGDPECGRGKNN